MEAQLIEKVSAPSAIVDGHQQQFIKPEPLEALMDAVSREIRNKLVTNIAAYCDCV